MLVKEVMKDNVEVVYEDTTLLDAAKKMKDLGIGAIPVRKGDRLIGMLTDRDIVIRGIAEGKDPASTPVSKCITSPITYVYDDQDVNDAAKLMQDKLIRRLPVLNRDKRLVGIVSLSDFGTRGNSDELAGRTLKTVAQGHAAAQHQH